MADIEMVAKYNDSFTVQKSDDKITGLTVDCDYDTVFNGEVISRFTKTVDIWPLLSNADKKALEKIYDLIQTGIAPTIRSG